MDQSHDQDDAHDPEDQPIFELTCPRCGTPLPTASHTPLDGEPGHETVTCPSCGYDVRLIADPTLT